MSHHHMLTPIVYVPEVKPKKIEPRRSRVQMHAAGSVDDAGETEQTFQPMSVGIKLPLQNFLPVEGADQKPQHPEGRLSEGTLKVMLQVQESKQRFA
jgi:hypothetical protein